MTGFKVLIIKEHVADDVKKIDNRMCILYDSSEETYYYYGTRNNTNESNYINYNGSYHYTEFDKFMTFLLYTMNNFSEVITTELHVVDILEKEYSTLNYNNILKKMYAKTLLAAYDETFETEDSIGKYLGML